MALVIVALAMANAHAQRISVRYSLERSLVAIGSSLALLAPIEGDGVELETSVTVIDPHRGRITRSFVAKGYMAGRKGGTLVFRRESSYDFGGTQGQRGWLQSAAPVLLDVDGVQVVETWPSEYLVRNDGTRLRLRLSIRGSSPAFAVSPSGGRLAAVSVPLTEEGTSKVWLWDLERGRLILNRSIVLGNRGVTIATPSIAFVGEDRLAALVPLPNSVSRQGFTPRSVVLIGCDGRVQERLGTVETDDRSDMPQVAVADGRVCVLGRDEVVVFPLRAVTPRGRNAFAELRERW